MGNNRHWANVFLLIVVVVLLFLGLFEVLSADFPHAVFFVVTSLLIEVGREYLLQGKK